VYDGEVKEALLSKKDLKSPEIIYKFIESEDAEQRLNNAFDILFDEMDKSPNVDKL